MTYNEKEKKKMKEKEKEKEKEKVNVKVKSEAKQEKYKTKNQDLQVDDTVNNNNNHNSNDSIIVDADDSNYTVVEGYNNNNNNDNPNNIQKENNKERLLSSNNTITSTNKKITVHNNTNNDNIMNHSQTLLNNNNNNNNNNKTLDFKKAYALYRVNQGESEIMKDMLGRGFHKLTYNEQEKLRCRRSKRGVKCHECGINGFYRSSCPECPPAMYDIEQGKWVLLEDWKTRKEKEKTDKTVKMAIPLEDKYQDMMEVEKSQYPEIDIRDRSSAWFWSSESKTIQKNFQEIYPPAENWVFEDDKLNYVKPKKITVIEEKLRYDKKDWRIGKNDAIGWFPEYKTLKHPANPHLSKFKNVKRRMPSSCAPDKKTDHALDIAKNEKLEIAKDVAIKKNKQLKQVESCGNYAFNNLHQVLIRMIQVIFENLNKVIPEFSDSIFCSPAQEVGEEYYPKAIWDMYSTYFNEELTKEMRFSKTNSHLYMGNMRREDHIIQPWDRSNKTGKERREEIRQNYEKDDMAGKRTIHDPVSWKSILGKFDHLSQGGKKAFEEAERIKQAFKNQGKWAESQRQFMENKRKVCTHLMEILKEELSKEEKRMLEMCVPHMSQKKDPEKERQLNKRCAEIVKERADTADKLMDVMKHYKLITGIELTEYLQYTVESMARSGAANAKTRIPGGYNPISGNGGAYNKSSKNGISRVGRMAFSMGKDMRENGDTNDTNFNTTTPRSETNASETETEFSQKDTTSKNNTAEENNKKDSANNKKKKSQKDNGISDMAAKEGMYAAQSSFSFTRKHKTVSIKRKKKKPYVPFGPHGMGDFENAKRCFNAKGYTIRKGIDEDTINVPTLIPIPECFATEGSFAQTGRDSGQEKSYIAGKILEKVRDKHFCPVTSKVVNHGGAAIWTRMSEKPVGPRCTEYSPILGHNYNHLYTDIVTGENYDYKPKKMKQKTERQAVQHIKDHDGLYQIEYGNRFEKIMQHRVEDMLARKEISRKDVWNKYNNKKRYKEMKKIYMLPRNQMIKNLKHPPLI